MKNSFAVSSQNLVHLIKLVPMFKLDLEQPGVNGSNQQKQERWLTSSAILFSCRLLTTNATENGNPLWVFFDSFRNKKILPLFLHNLIISCPTWVLQLTLLMMTHYQSNSCLNTYLFLNNPFLVHYGQYLIFLTTRRERLKSFETHFYTSSSVSVNQIFQFKKMRICLNRILNN